MKGIWTWPSEPAEQAKAILKVAREDELVSILTALTESPEGLSNAELDKLLKNNSQWRTRIHLEELLATGLVQYNVQLFGNAGRYELTELGRSVMSRIQAP